MKSTDPYKLIVTSLKEKSTFKKEVLDRTRQHFGTFCEEARRLSDELCEEMGCVEGVEVTFNQKGAMQVELTLAEDVLIFFMHNDVFHFDSGHTVWKGSYVQRDRMNAYCGMISIFNFLKTSFEMNRQNDVGYLIGRVFVNHESHYFTDGKRQLGFLYNDFGNSLLDCSSVRSIIMSSILYCLEFDLLTPPFDSMKELQVGKMIEISNTLRLKTGKRLGFRFSADTDEVE